MTKHENSVLFTTLFVIALMIRLPGVDYGLQAGAPFFVHWPDEGNVLRWTLALGMGEFSPTGGNFFYFTSLIILGLKFVVGFLAGWYSGLDGFRQEFFADPHNLYLLGRLWVAFLSSLSVAMLYLVGRKFFSRAVGILAAVLLMLNFNHYYFAHVFRLDGAFPLFFVLSLLGCYFMVRSKKSGEESPKVAYIVAGILGGLCAATKYPGMAVIVPLVMTHLLVSSGSVWSRLWSARLILLLASFTLIFVLINMNIFADLGTFQKKFGYGVIDSGSQMGGIKYRTTEGHSWLRYLGDIFPASMGVGPYVLVVLSLIAATWYVAAKRGSRSDRLFLVLCLGLVVSYFGPVGYFSRATWRDILPLLPVLFVIAAFVVDKARNFLAARLGWKIPFVLAMIFILVLNSENLISIQNFISVIGREDTRDEAKNWIHENIPAGSKIALDGSSYHPSLLQTKEQLTSIYNRSQSQQIKYLIQYLGDDTARRYNLDISLMNHSTEVSVFDTLKADYFIVSSGRYSRYYDNEFMLTQRPEIVARKHRIYDYIESHSDLLVTFMPGERPGPILKIYKSAPLINKYRKFDPFPGKLKISVVGQYE